MSQQAHGETAASVDYRKGALIALVGVVVLSWDATFIRLADVTAWNAAFWRGAFIALALFVFLLAGRKLHEFSLLARFGGAAWLICALFGLNTFLFVLSVSYTKVANTVIILSTTPVFAALFSKFILGEAIRSRTVWAMLFAMLGVGVVVAGSANVTGNFGDWIALLLAALTGYLFTVLHRYPDFPRMPAVTLGAAVSALFLLPFSSPLSVSGASLGWLALMGLFQKPVASVCMLLATRYLPAPQVGLFFLLEAVLAPFWAWWVVSETPQIGTIAGGAVVILALAVHSWLEIRRP